MPKARIDLTPKGYTYSIKVRGYARWLLPIEKDEYGFRRTREWATREDTRAAAEKRHGQVDWVN